MGQQVVNQLLFGVGYFVVVLDQIGFGVVDYFYFVQVVGFQSGVGGDEVVNGVGEVGVWCYFYGVVQQIGFKGDIFLIEVMFQQVWVRGGDMFVVQCCWVISGFIYWSCQ